MKKPELIQLRIFRSGIITSTDCLLSNKMKVDNEKIITSTDSTVSAFALKRKSNCRGKQLYNANNIKEIHTMRIIAGLRISLNTSR